METDSESVAVADARSNLTRLVNRAEIQRTGFLITRRGTKVAALVPVELWEAALAAGGADKATEMLRRASLSATSLGQSTLTEEL